MVLKFSILTSLDLFFSFTNLMSNQIILFLILLYLKFIISSNHLSLLNHHTKLKAIDFDIKSLRFAFNFTQKVFYF